MKTSLRSLAQLTCLFLPLMAGCATEEAARRDGAVVPDRGAGDAGAATLRAVLNERYPVELFKLVDGAKKTLRLVHFMINEDSAGKELVQKLGQAAKRGVDVRVLLEDSVDGNAGQVSALAALGVSAKVDEKAIYTHAKLAVVDGAQVLLGSSNFSWSSMYKNNEANLLSNDPVLVGYFVKLADALWLAPGKRPTLPAATTSLGKALSDGQYPAEAMALIKAAKKRIYIVTYGMNLNTQYPDSDLYKLVDQMASAAKAGVDVRVLLEQADYNAGVNSINKASATQLKQRGLTVRRDPLARITHAKVLICDDQVILGSNNWGYGGFSLYHEVGLRTGYAPVVKELATYFSGIWAAGADM